MSRSNPQENGLPNPAVRWFEWTSEKGLVRYYDRDQKQNVEVGSKFSFVLLDQLGSVRGWHDASQSGIYSNEVKNTREDILTVKAFKEGTLAEGIYREIKDRVNSLGGRFVTNCYIAFKGDDGQMAVGSLRFKGAALGAWMAFCKDNRADLYKKAIAIDGYTEGKKGRVTFRVPALKIQELSEATNQQCIDLDKTLQAFLDVYLAKTKHAPADSAATHTPEAGEGEWSSSADDIAPDESSMPF